MLFVRAHLHMRETFRPSVGQMVAVAQRCLSDGPARPGPAGRKQWSWSEASLAGVFELLGCDHHPIFHIIFAREVGAECCIAQSLDASPTQHKAAQQTTQGRTMKLQEPRPGLQSMMHAHSSQQALGQGEGMNYLQSYSTGLVKALKREAAMQAARSPGLQIVKSVKEIRVL